MKLKIVLILNTFLVLFLTQPLFGQTNPPADSNTENIHRTQTDKVLLRDGSEKQHVTKKVKPATTPVPSGGAGLPTDVD